MPRNFHNARRHYDTRMSFKDLCKMLGVGPMERTIISRWFRQYDLKVGENNMDENTQTVTDTQTLSVVINGVPFAPESAPVEPAASHVPVVTVDGVTFVPEVTASE